MTAADVFAPAKINLTLHVTGQRNDGYHLLDSLVVFASVGDRVKARAAPGLSLGTSGQFGDQVPLNGSNLVLRAAQLAIEHAPAGSGASLTLEKELPPASGIGGGSSDAAATLKALAQLWGCALPSTDDCLSLGADVPVCLYARACRMQGIGEGLTPVPDLPPLSAVLVNPGVEIPTPAIFAALKEKANPPMPATLPGFQTAQDLAVWLRAHRNDLQPPAEALCPEIGTVLAALDGQKDCLLTRMSGSGATCFALYSTQHAADTAAAHIQKSKPGWWVQSVSLA